MTPASPCSVTSRRRPSSLATNRPTSTSTRISCSPVSTSHATTPFERAGEQASVADEAGAGPELRVTQAEDRDLLGGRHVPHAETPRTSCRSIPLNAATKRPSGLNVTTAEPAHLAAGSCRGTFPSSLPIHTSPRAWPTANSSPFGETATPSKQPTCLEDRVAGGRHRALEGPQTDL